MHIPYYNGMTYPLSKAIPCLTLLVHCVAGAWIVLMCIVTALQQPVHLLRFQRAKQRSLICEATGALHAGVAGLQGLKAC